MEITQARKRSLTVPTCFQQGQFEEPGIQAYYTYVLFMYLGELGGDVTSSHPQKKGSLECEYC